MKKSNWLKKHVKEAQRERDKREHKKLIIPLLSPILVIFFAIIGLNVAEKQNCKLCNKKNKNIILAIFGVIAVIVDVIIIIRYKKQKIDATYTTRQNVEELIETEEELESFDEQMSKPPLREVIIPEAENSKFFTTKDYIGKTFTMLDDIQYRYAKKTDIAKVSYSYRMLRDIKYIDFDIVDKEGEAIMGVIVYTHEEFNEIIDILKEIQPDLVVAKDKGPGMFDMVIDSLDD